MSDFKTFREIDIHVVIDGYQPLHKSASPMCPDEPEDIEISAWMIISKGKKNYKFQLTKEQVEALDLEQEAIDYVKQDRLSSYIDRVLEERREVPDALREAIGIMADCFSGRDL